MAQFQRALRLAQEIKHSLVDSAAVRLEKGCLLFFKDTHILDYLSRKASRRPVSAFLPVYREENGGSKQRRALLRLQSGKSIIRI